MVWKKNSVGVRPEKKLFLTKPLAAGILAEIKKDDGDDDDDDGDDDDIGDNAWW